MFLFLEFIVMHCLSRFSSWRTARNQPDTKLPNYKAMETKVCV